eukprot:GGOE01043581.1.p1 GENE.GGOE01043581.1~~GGOE01043581.1.p1  ORF type:complete len:344 (-),score=60.30 GGOE01043581.1:112-1143(-)
MGVLSGALVTFLLLLRGCSSIAAGMQPSKSCRYRLLVATAVGDSAAGRLDALFSPWPLPCISLAVFHYQPIGDPAVWLEHDWYRRAHLRVDNETGVMRLVYYKKYLSPDLVLGGQSDTGIVMPHPQCQAAGDRCRPFDWVLLLDDDFTLQGPLVSFLDICTDKAAMLCQPASWNSLRRFTHPIPHLLARHGDYVEFGQMTALRPAVWLAFRTLHPPPFKFGGLDFIWCRLTMEFLQPRHAACLIVDCIRTRHLDLKSGRKTKTSGYSIRTFAAEFAAFHAVFPELWARERNLRLWRPGRPKVIVPYNVSYTALLAHAVHLLRSRGASLIGNLTLALNAPRPWW